MMILISVLACLCLLNALLAAVVVAEGREPTGNLVSAILYGIIALGLYLNT